MTYQELVSKLKDTYQEKDASKISEHLAIQFNIQGEAEGALYLEIATGKAFSRISNWNTNTAVRKMKVMT